jgi:hypothetical protein
MRVAIYAQRAMLSLPMRGMLCADGPACRRFSISDRELTSLPAPQRSQI